MKTRLLLFAALALGAGGCSAVDPYRSVRIELPSVIPLQISDYREVLVVPFKEEASPGGFALAKEATTFFAEELARHYKGRIVTLPAAEAAPPALEDEAAWKDKGAGHPQTLFLAGVVRLSSEVRKAINESERDVEGPFKKTGTGLSERRLYTLTMTLGLVDAATGRPLYRKEYKEVRTYIATKQPAEFAFYELVDRVQLKFFHTILGTERIQERYLLSR